MHLSIRLRLAALKRHFTMQLSHYSESGFGDDLGLFWLALFAVRRTSRTEALLDAWWLEVRRWQYRDQISLPFALWGSELGPPSISLVHLANESGVCELLVGATDRCCRRCAAAATHFSSWTGLGAELRGSDQNQTDEERGLQRPATNRNKCVARTRAFSLARSLMRLNFARLTYEYSHGTRHQQRKAEALALRVEDAVQEKNVAKKRTADLDAAKRSVTIAAVRACRRNPMGAVCRNSKQKAVAAGESLTASFAAIDAAEQARLYAAKKKKMAERKAAEAAAALAELSKSKDR